MKRIIAITGGIGTGKSVVCRVLKALDFPIYDCDSQAKRLMNSNHEMKLRIVTEITPSALNSDNSLNRSAIAEVVFSNQEKLKTLNSIVHGAVRTHFCQWVKQTCAPITFVETAILYESGFDKLVTEVWEVTAPLDVRIDRIAQRNGLKHDEIMNRIASQNTESSASHSIIVNDGKTAVLPQILRLLNK